MNGASASPKRPTSHRLIRPYCGSKSRIQPIVTGNSGKKKPSHSASSMKPLNGVSVRVTTQAKKIASAVVTTTRSEASRKVLPSAIGNLASLKASIQP